MLSTQKLKPLTPPRSLASIENVSVVLPLPPLTLAVGAEASCHVEPSQCARPKLLSLSLATNRHSAPAAFWLPVVAFWSVSRRIATLSVLARAFSKLTSDLIYRCPSPQPTPDVL